MEEPKAASDAEIQRVTRSVTDYTETELNLGRTMVVSGSVGVACIAMNDSVFGQPSGFEEQMIEHAAMIIFWSGSDAFDQKG